LLFGAPASLCLAARTPFAALCTQVLPGIFGLHPDFAQIDWDRVLWTKSGQAWQPDPGKTLAENGLTHKDLIAFRAPGLKGLGGTGN
jgi:phenol hydroxylase P4 protein